MQLALWGGCVIRKENMAYLVPAPRQFSAKSHGRGVSAVVVYKDSHKWPEKVLLSPEYAGVRSTPSRQFPFARWRAIILQNKPEALGYWPLKEAKPEENHYCSNIRNRQEQNSGILPEGQSVILS